MKSLFGKLSNKSGRKKSGLAEAISFSEHNKGMATLTIPDIVPSPAHDSEALKKAFDGLGTDEMAVIRILGHRNASQRRKIRETYQQLYNESLIDRLFSELSGDFRKAIILWTSDPPERDAKLAQDALKMSKKDVKHLKIIVEIACASSPHHLMTVRQAYTSLFDCSMEEDIASNVSPSLRKLLVGLVSSYRYDKEVVDLVVANSEASKLHEAIKTKQLDHDNVIWILSTRNFYQLRATFESYKMTYGNPIEQDVKSCGNGNLESLLKVVICCLESPEKHFAEVIKDSTVGLGTDEDSLTRAIVTRAEIDLMKVREQYQNLYKTNLDDAVVDDTSGDYKDFLMSLLGAPI
ncbi:Annexin [Parasponia andersonii]|uniref:Annexin n=1 Tax=Parasponia andersonii TaxID=3476 RepID=A0A2P5BLA9_PARAD|nr:Annexin [Parasponia andersonii]